MIADARFGSDPVLAARVDGALAARAGRGLHLVAGAEPEASADEGVTDG